MFVKDAEESDMLDFSRLDGVFFSSFLREELWFDQNTLSWMLGIWEIKYGTKFWL